MDFYIDEAYLTDVEVRMEYNHYDNHTDLTPDELINALKNPGRVVSVGHKDHPEFTVLREQLERDGYIAVERGWWNGDRVLKPFRLNDEQFGKGEQFPCAVAMGIHLKVQKKYSKRSKHEKSN